MVRNRCDLLTQCRPRLPRRCAASAKIWGTRRGMKRRVLNRGSVSGRSGFVVNVEQESERLISSNASLIRAERVDDLVQDHELLVRVQIHDFPVHESGEVVKDLAVGIVLARFGIDA